MEIMPQSQNGNSSFHIIGVDGYMQQFTSTFYKIGEWFLGCLLILYFLFPIFRYFVSPNKRTFFGGSILFSILAYWAFFVFATRW